MPGATLAGGAGLLAVDGFAAAPEAYQTDRDADDGAAGPAGALHDGPAHLVGGRGLYPGQFLPGTGEPSSGSLQLLVTRAQITFELTDPLLLFGDLVAKLDESATGRPRHHVAEDVFGGEPKRVAQAGLLRSRRQRGVVRRP